MGKKVGLAPRNSAEAVALGVSACFLVVAGVVVHGNASVERANESSNPSYAAAVEVPRTYSHPSPRLTVGSRVPVLTAEPPLVMLPVNQQVAAKLAAQGTWRGDGVILVAYQRGAATLSGGGGLSGIVVGSQASPTHLSGAVGFPTSTVAPGSGAITITPPPTPPAAAGPTTPPTTGPTTPPTTEPTTPPTTEPTTPPTTEPTTPPTTEPTTPPTTEQTTPPTDPGSGTGDGSSTDSGSTNGSTTGSGTGSTTGAENAVTTGETARAEPVPAAPAPAPPAQAPPAQAPPAQGPTPQGGDV